MRKILVNIKDAVEILEDFKEQLVELREQAEEIAANTKNDGKYWRENLDTNREYNFVLNVETKVRISYNPQNKKGFILLAKTHHDIEYIIRTDFVYLDNNVILDII